MLLTERVGASAALDLEPLKHPLQDIKTFLAGRLGTVGELAAVAVPAAGDAPGAAQEGVSVQAGTSMNIASRADVIAILDRVCAYYALHEPSSPVPLLLARARSLVDKSFIDVIRDLAPDGLAQVMNVAGTSE